MKGTVHQSCKYVDITSLQCYVICLFVIFQYFTFHSRTALMHHMNSGAGMRSKDGAVVRALASHQCVPGSIHMWVEFVVGSLPCSEGFFSGYSSFPSPQKFQFDLDYCQAFYHEPLARVIAQTLPVFDIKFTF